jgi:2-polyprenyl-6-methoxyphenol hydroxylase-like FAD-dependent oxidoreductase
MKNVVADKWYKNQCFIIGDAAHQFPPSGGYGMNTGISDAFSLYWRIENLLKLKLDNENENEIEEKLKEDFNKERLIHSKVK